METKSIYFKACICICPVLITVVIVYFYFNSKKDETSRKRDYIGVSIDEIDGNEEFLGSHEHISGYSKNRENINQATDLKRKGNDHFKCKKYLMAIKLYEEALESVPQQFKNDKAVILHNISAALFELNRMEEALVKINESLELFPTYKNALIRRSKIYETKHSFHDAFFDVVAAAVFDCTDKEEVALDRIDRIGKQLANSSVEEKLKMNPILQSDTCIKTYFESFPNDPLLNIEDNFAILENNNNSVNDCFELLKSGKYQESFLAVQKIFKMSDFNKEMLVHLHLLRGTLHFLSCREDLALNDFDMIIKSHTAKPSIRVNALIKRAMIMLNDDKFDEVEKDFEEALQIDSRCPDIYYQRGLYYELSDQNKKAVDDFGKALKFNSEFVFAIIHKLLNESLDTDSSHEDIFRQFQVLADRFQDSVEVCVTHIKVLMHNEKFADAKQVLATLPSSHYNSVSILILAAKLKTLQNEEDQAKEILMKAVEKDPKNSEAHHCLAGSCYRLFDLEKSIEHLNNAIKFSKTRKEMRDYIIFYEVCRAQLNVSRQFDIPVKDVVNKISQGLF